MVTAGLGINLIGLDKKINKISGGQCAKVILAKLLLEKLDVLLLDELTNFLDTKHINFMGTYIVISHDFDFLDKITDCILNIDYYTIKNIVENIHLFKTKKRLRTDYLRRYQKQQKHIKNGTIYPQKYSWE